MLIAYGHFSWSLTIVRSGQIILPLGLPMHNDMQFWCTLFASVLGWTLVNSDEHRRIVRDLADHIDKKMEACRSMGA